MPGCFLLKSIGTRNLPRLGNSIVRLNHRRKTLFAGSLGEALRVLGKLYERVICSQLIAGGFGGGS
jgi:hypothetical protein